MRFQTLIIITMALVGLGCGEPNVLDYTTVNNPPDLNFGTKGDNASSNTVRGEAIEPGRAVNGTSRDYVAFPVELTDYNTVTFQAWTSKPSVLFVYGPLVNGNWDMEQIREFSRNVKPGVESRSIEFQPATPGTYLLVLGPRDGETNEWIIARAAPENN